MTNFADELKADADWLVDYDTAFPPRRWLCGKCEGGNVPFHSQRCPKRDDAIWVGWEMELDAELRRLGAAPGGSRFETRIEDHGMIGLYLKRD